MEDLIFLIFILIIFFVNLLGQIFRRGKEVPQEEDSSREITLEDILETMNPPYPEEEKKVPVESVVIEQPEENKKLEEKPEEEIKELEKDEEIREELETAEKKKRLNFPEDLETAIIYSTILGKPKALQIRRGAGTGIQAGLKNRCP